MKKLVGVIGGAIIIAAIVWGFLAFFVINEYPTGLFRDGLGRVLSTSPFFMRVIFGEERLWAGWGWFFADMVIYFGAIGLGFLCLHYYWKDKNTKS